MAVYAAMVDRMDRNIGRVLEKVRALGKEDNTLVLFLLLLSHCHGNRCPHVPLGLTSSSYGH